MAELQILKYTSNLKKDWDEFILRSKNGTFLLQRDYMDYHSDRFLDHSLLFLKGGSIQAVMPACKIGDSLVSHGGLTYGGYIMSRKTTAEDTLRFFFMLREQLRSEGFRKLIYKPVPHIYHAMPAEEDLYALFRLDASLEVRNVSATLYSPDRPPFRNIRKTGIRKANHFDVSVKESSDYSTFWKILEENLSYKYKASPVHTVDEITALAKLFPNNIKLYMAFSNEDIPLGGTILFITPLVVHTQYISASPEGKACGALDLLFDNLINQTFSQHKYFDFGTSNEDGGHILNESLMYQKEGFGARAICYDTYSIEL